MAIGQYFSASVKPSKLRAVLQRLDALVDWERKRRSVPGAARLMRVSNAPANHLLSRLGNPQQGLKSVHITGSKGKGSVATLVSAALQKAPFTKGCIGTYGSPHVEAINERIRFNSVPVSDDILADCLQEVLNARESPSPLDDATWFDVMTVAGLLSFQKQHVDWAVVEAGMGGRLDSTNVLSAPVSVITNIHLEHAEIIGPALSDIAHEKAGIMAPGSEVIIGMSPSDELASMFQREAVSRSPHSQITFVSPDSTTIFNHNLRLAREALRAVAALHKDFTPPEVLLPEELAVQALSSLPARQEPFMIDSLKVILDGAHVANSVAQVLRECRGEQSPIVVIGLGREKDVHGICQALIKETPVQVIATSAGKEDPYLAASALRDVLIALGAKNVSSEEDAMLALHQAIDSAKELRTDVIILGSLHLAGKIRPELRRLAGMKEDTPTEEAGTT